MTQFFSLIFKYKIVMIVVLGIFSLASFHALRNLPVDAFPDTSSIQVQINTTAPSLGPLEIEQQITAVVEQSIGGLPGLIDVRSISKFGLSQVVAVFDDHTSIYKARQLVSEAIASVELPAGIDLPRLGPISTGLGEIFHYTVSSDNPLRSLEEIRTIHDWMIKPGLRKVQGVAEVNSWGGCELQYQVIIKPDMLFERGITLDEVVIALQNNNQNRGGGEIVSSGQSIVVYGSGRLTHSDEIAKVVIRTQDGVPIRIEDIASVKKGQEIRHGAVTSSGKGEVVLGLGFMLLGENSKQVTKRLTQKLDEITKYLPKDIVVAIVYDRSELVEEVISTVKHNLMAGAVFVVLLLFVLMGNLRAGIIVALTIPFAALFAFFGMYHCSVAASLLSLGAMDFGVLVDGSIVMVDAHSNHLIQTRLLLGRKLTKAERIDCIIEASTRVVRPIVFGLSIIAVVFLPILSLEHVEGKLFKPMAWTFIFALIGAVIIAVMYTPVFSYYFLPLQSTHTENRVVLFLKQNYKKILEYCIPRPRRFIVSVSVIVLVVIALGSRLGGVFIPKLSEGALVINLIRLAGVSLDETVAYNTRIEQMLLEHFPDEIDKCWSRIGSAEVATDPMGTELSDIFIALHPRHEWKKAKTQQQLVQRINTYMADLPGLNYVFTQPIEMRLNEMLSGISSDVGIKIIGDNFDTLLVLSEKIQRELSAIKGASEVRGEQITGQPVYQFSLNHEKLSRFGVSAQNIMETIALNGNLHVGELIQEQRRFPITLRLPDEFRTSITAWQRLQLSLGEGRRIPLTELVDIKLTEAPSTITHEWGKRLVKVQCNIQDRDIASFVNEAQSRMKKNIQMPQGYQLEWGGQFENLQRSQTKFLFLIPFTFILIFILLFFSVGNGKDVMIIYSGLPFAMVGGVVALFICKLPFSVSAAVGFIALSGIAVLNGQILVNAIKERITLGFPFKEAILESSISRLRPVLATAAVDIAGFIPMALSTGVGSEVQKPVATVVIGGLLTSTLLTLIILPLFYVVFSKNSIVDTEIFSKNG